MYVTWTNVADSWGLGSFLFLYFRMFYFLILMIPRPPRSTLFPCAAPFLSQAEDGIRDWSVTGVQTYAAFCLRSEEHTSELQSLTNIVCRLLLEKKRHELQKTAI